MTRKFRLAALCLAAIVSGCVSPYQQAVQECGNGVGMTECVRSRTSEIFQERAISAQQLQDAAANLQAYGLALQQNDVDMTIAARPARSWVCTPSGWNNGTMNCN